MTDAIYELLRHVCLITYLLKDLSLSFQITRAETREHGHHILAAHKGVQVQKTHQVNVRRPEQHTVQNSLQV